MPSPPPAWLARSRDTWDDLWRLSLHPEPWADFCAEQSLPPTFTAARLVLVMRVKVADRLAWVAVLGYGLILAGACIGALTSRHPVVIVLALVVAFASGWKAARSNGNGVLTEINRSLASYVARLPKLEGSP